MKYFLRDPDNLAITGPFELYAIDAKLKAGELSGGTLATGDIGEGVARVQNAPPEDWVPAESIPGLGGEQPPSSQLSPPLPPPLALGDTWSRKRAESLAPAAKQPTPPHPLIVLLVQVPGGFLVQVISFFFLCGCLGVFFRFPNGTLILCAVIHCLASVAIGIAMWRSPVIRGFSYGIFIGLCLTGLLTGSCASK